MTLKKWFLIFLMLFGFAFVPTGPLQAQPTSTLSSNQDDLFALFEKFNRAYDKIQDYSAKLYKEELSKEGKWEKEILDFRFKKPFKVRIKWIKGHKKDREVVFVEGENNNKIQVKLAGIISILLHKISVDPNSDMARDESGHTIREAGLGHMTDEILKVTEEAQKKGDLTLNLLEKEKNSDGSGEILKIERKVPHGKGYATDRLIIYVDENLGIPVGVERYDANGKLFGKYYYHELKTNQGLKDEEFRL